MTTATKKSTKAITAEDFKKEVLNDFKIANESRQASILGRRDVLTGKGKFGIFGDGKELPQIALAKYFNNGDFRAGYYRDQTFMMASSLLNVKQFFAQMYADSDISHDPFSAGRNMTGHYSTKSIDNEGNWLRLTDQKNSSGDIAPTASQMARMVGLGWASKLYRNNPELADMTGFSKNGNEICFGTIGDASTSEGLFWEAVNACGVLQIPVVLSVWDDGYGISVAQKHQTTKQSISTILKGFETDENGKGFKIIKVKAWDYVALCEAYKEATEIARTQHMPVLVHVQEVTQPQGHSTSGSHERYKTPERLQFEKDFDCLVRFKEWILKTNIATEAELTEIEDAAKKHVKDSRNTAWEEFMKTIKEEISTVANYISTMAKNSAKAQELTELHKWLTTYLDPLRKESIVAAKKALRIVKDETIEGKNELKAWLKTINEVNKERYNSHLYIQGKTATVNVKGIAPEYNGDEIMVDGREIIRDTVDAIMARDKRVVIFGEDVGFIGGVNQTYEGLQKKYGEVRISDMGIREATIMGQAIGAALRGLRPIAEIQYLDYLMYGLQPLTDDAATLHYRTKGGQKCPIIITTRGHRLEGIFHSGSPMAVVLNSLRGFHVCVPRNMTQAAGFYNTLLEGEDPAILVECLNGYRIKERKPSNIGAYKVELGIPEILQKGSDITVVSYGSTLRIVEDACKQLLEYGINAEVIDVQTLLPFDKNHLILESLKKTNKLLVVDEDVPGGASAFITNQILEVQGGFAYLDSKPVSLTAMEHRSPYGTDGDYFSKPNAEQVFDAVYEMMREYNPAKFNSIY